MPRKPSDVDVWLGRETPRVRKALESASRHFDSNDELTVNTLEAVYGQENSFGIRLGQRGSSDPAGHFQFKAKTAREYGLIVSKGNDQRFDIDRASSAAARYLKDLNTWFGRRTTFGKERTVPIKSISERKKFVLGAFNAGPGRVSGAQRRAGQAGKNPQLWNDVAEYLSQETQQYVEKVPMNEAEFARKSSANKNSKKKEAGKKKQLCTVGHWRTIDDRPVFICT